MLKLKIGKALEGMGRYSEAIQEFKKAISLNPKNFLAHYYLTLVYKKIGLIKKVKRESEKALTLVPFQIIVRNSLINTLKVA